MTHPHIAKLRESVQRRIAQREMLRQLAIGLEAEKARMAEQAAQQAKNALSERQNTQG